MLELECLFLGHKPLNIYTTWTRCKNCDKQIYMLRLDETKYIWKVYETK